MPFFKGLYTPNDFAAAKEFAYSDSFQMKESFQIEVPP